MKSELLPTTKRMNLRAKKKKDGGITPLSFRNLCVLCFESDFKATWGWKSPCCVGGKLLLFFVSNTVIQQCTPVQNKIKMLISILVFRGWSNRGWFFSAVRVCSFQLISVSSNLLRATNPSQIPKGIAGKIKEKTLVQMSFTHFSCLFQNKIQLKAGDNDSAV